jgi:hypothetical protein
MITYNIGVRSQPDPTTGFQGNVCVQNVKSVGGGVESLGLAPLAAFHSIKVCYSRVLGGSEGRTPVSAQTCACHFAMALGVACQKWIALCVAKGQFTASWLAAQVP